MQPIKIVRGTSMDINVTIRDANGDVVTLGEGEFLRFGVKKDASDTAYLIQKTIDSSAQVGDGYIISLIPSDTMSLNFGRYNYDIGLQSGTDYYMVVDCSWFDVAANITKYAAV